MSKRDFTEFGLISEIKKWVADKKLLVPIGDDAAAFKTAPDKVSLYTADSLIENVHFKLDNSPDLLGYKSLVVNISDIAAMGGTPTFATVCLGIPETITLDFIKNFYRGLKNVADDYEMTIAGGDLSSSKELIISISVLGDVEESKILRRDSAKPGDKILVTGNLGSSAAGLKIALDSNIENDHLLLEKHLEPVAKVKQGKLAAELGVKVAIDVSDGLISDCQRICEASNVGCRINAAEVPIDKNVIEFCKDNNINPLDLALAGGEDYELIFCSPSEISKILLAEFKTRGWELSEIGNITDDKDVKVLDKNKEIIPFKSGYEHFVNGG